MADRPYKPCKSCGSTRVERMVTESCDADREAVIVICAGCDVRRASYTRKKR